MTLVMETNVILRGLVVEAIKAYGTLAKNNVVELGDWPSQPDSLPQIYVYDGHSSAQSIARAQPNFTTTSYIMADCRLDAETLADARRACDTIEAQVKQAVLTNFDIIRLLQQVASVQTQKKITTDSGKHVGSVQIEFAMEYFQSQEEYYAPVNPAPLDTIGIHADLENVYDATGTYANPPFPDSVTPAPRTEGPDGRDEGYIEVDSLQS